MTLVNTAVVSYQYNSNQYQQKTYFNFWKDENFMSNKCFTCVKSTSITVVANNVIIAIPDGNYYDNQIVQLCLCQSMPVTVTPAMSFVVKMGTAATLYPLNTKCGHLVYGDQLKTRRIYILRVATDTKRFTYVDGASLICTKHINPPVLTAITATAAETIEPVVAKAK